MGDGLLPGTQMGPLISERQRETVHGYVKVGVEEGAQLLGGGAVPADPALAEGWFYPPTILAGVKPGMRVEQEKYRPGPLRGSSA